MATEISLPSRQTQRKLSFMERAFRGLVVAGLVAAQGCRLGTDAPARSRQTEVSVRGEDFFINGKPTYAGRTWNGHKIEGLLFNSRMVQGIFDNLNPATAARWNYP